MFRTLKKSLKNGLVTIGYPNAPAELPGHYRGAPAFDPENWRDARPAAAACPSGALTAQDSDGRRRVTFDLGKCIFCGACGDADPEVTASRDFELAVTDREALVFTADYELAPDGSQRRLVGASRPALEQRVRRAIDRTLGRSLAIREVDAGSCNGCEVEISGLNSPVYDIERLGIHFVASPRHADMLLVTGPVTRNMELALYKTYQATPEPKVVVAVGACGISGGMFGANYATVGAVDRVVPVDVYIPGCPPRPEALLFGILLAVGRIGRDEPGTTAI